MAHNPITGEEEQHDYYPGALPAANVDQLGAVRDDLFEEAKGYVRTDPRFKDLTFGEGEGWDEEVTVGGAEQIPTEITEPDDGGWDEAVVMPEAPEEEPGFISNTARLAADRALDLTGRLIRTAGRAGEAIEEKFDIGSFVWGDDKGFRYVSRDELNALKEQGVSENLLLDTIPNAFIDVDLGGEERNTTQDIKDNYNEGNVAGTAAAVMKFAGEQFIQSIPDMIATVFAMPLYIAARSDEIAEERVRNERLSEALALGLSAQDAYKEQERYVSGEDITIGQQTKALPWTALAAMLERIGAKGVGNAGKEAVALVAKEATEAGMKAVVKAGGKAGGKEAGTEFFQEGVLEYAGEKFGTSESGLLATMSVAEGFERGAFGALAGGIGGGVAGTTIAAGREVLRPREGGTPPTTPQEDMFPDTEQGTGPAGEQVVPVRERGPLDVEKSIPISETDVDAEGKPYIVKEAIVDEATAIPETDVDAEGKVKVADKISPQEDMFIATPAEAKAAAETIAPDAVAEPVEEIEPAETVAVVESPLIDKKTLKPKIDKHLKGTAEEQKPVRTAWRNLTNALRERFPDADLPGTGARTSGEGFGRFFQALQEQVDLTTDLPDLKTYLETVTTGTPAEIIKSLERVTSGVVAEIPSTTVGAGGPLLTQLRAIVNEFNVHEEERTKTKGGKARNVITHAKELGELAAGVRAAVLEAEQLGALEGLPADFNQTIASAVKFAQQAQAPQEKKTAAGGKTLKIEVTRKGLVGISKKLLTIADQVSEQIASKETALSFDALEQSLIELDALIGGKPPGAAVAKKTSKAKKGDTKGKVKPTSSVTEAVTRAKTDRRTGKEEPHAMERRKLPRRKLAGVEELDVEETIPTLKEAQAQAKKDIAARVAETDKLLVEARAEVAKAEKKAAAGEKAAETSKKRSQPVKRKESMADVFKTPEEIAYEEARVELANTVLAAEPGVELADAVIGMGYDMGVFTMAQLRTIAKALGVKAGRSKVTAVEAIQKAALETRRASETTMMADEAVDLETEVKAKLPKKFHKGHVFHAVRSVKDIASIINDGLKAGTNLALNLVGQGIDTITDGGVILVFKDVPGSYKVKTYQNDGVAEAGLKPIAIVVDVLPGQDVAADLIGLGVPVFNTEGQQLNREVSGADPNEVFDPAPVKISGRRGARIVEEGEGEGTLQEFLEESGVTKKTADLLESIRRAVTPAQATQVHTAIREYMRHRDVLRFATELQEILGKTPSAEVMAPLMELINQMDAPVVAPDEGVREDMITAHVEEFGGTRANAADYLEGIGAFDEQVAWDDPKTEQDPDTFRRTKFNRADHLQMNRTMDKLRSFFEALAIPFFDSPGGYVAASLAGKLRQQKITVQEVLTELAGALPSNHRFSFLVKRLMQLGITDEVRIYSDRRGLREGPRSVGVFREGFVVTGGPVIIDKSKRKVEVYYNPDRQSDADFVKTLLHEIVHSATMLAYRTNDKFAAHIDELWRQAFRAYEVGIRGGLDLTTEQRADIEKKGLKSKKLIKKILEDSGDLDTFYGLVNPVELITESFTNANFQHFLGTTELEVTAPLQRISRPSKFKVLLDSFVGAIRKFLGYSTRNSLLEEVIVITDIAGFQTQAEIDAEITAVALGKKKLRMGGRDPRAESTEDPTEESEEEIKERNSVVNDLVDNFNAKESSFTKVADAVKEKLARLPKLNLGFMNRDVIERNYREVFGRAAKSVFNSVINPLTVYVKAKQAASVLARKYEMKAYKILMKAQKLSNTARSKMFASMRDVTLAEVWPDKPLNHPDNKHLWTKPNKKTGATKLRPTIAKAAIKARKEYQAMQKEHPEAAKILLEMAALTKEIQAAKQSKALEAIGRAYELSPATIEKLANAKTPADIETLFPIPDASIIEEMQPTKGDSNERKAAKKKSLDAIKENQHLNESSKKILKGTSIHGPYFPLRRYGDYVVSSTDDDVGEPIVMMVSNRYKAQKLSDELNEAGRDTHVSTKISSQAISADLQSVAVEISSRLTGKDSGVMRARLQTALIESLAENANYASQLRRNNIDGVAADDMGKAFEEYVHVSKYTIGDLATSHDIQAALNQLRQIQAAEEITGEDSLTIGDVVNEIAFQNKEDANDRDISTFQKAVGAIGFFNFLGAPSYWVLNATQTYTVTIPYITARWGAKALPALGDAQKTVLAAAAKALKSNDKSYEGFKKQLPPAALRIVERLEEGNIIQSTIAHEFGDILSPSTVTRIIAATPLLGRPTALGLHAMEKIPEAVEHFNRISTALAIYNLSGDIVAVEDGVQATQFNYDSANRARLLKALPMKAGGGARAIVTPVMMFKTYGVGITRLLYGSMIDAVLKKEGRAVALKTAGGLIVTHTLFGGVAGGVMLAPISALIWAFNQAFREAGDEFDPEEAVEEYFRDIGMDAMAVLARRGLPAAVLGIDMSKSINLGNLLWMGNDRFDFAESGGLEQSLAGLMGPVAQYGITSAREGYRLFSGDNRGNWHDFVAAAVPFKFIRGAVKGHKYRGEGLTTDSDLQFLDANQFTSWGRMAMGFRTTEISSAMDFHYGLGARDRRRSARKSQLVEQLARATTKKEIDAVMESIISFNRSLDSSAERINSGDRARLKSRRRSAQRQHDREHYR